MNKREIDSAFNRFAKLLGAIPDSDTQSATVETVGQSTPAEVTTTTTTSTPPNGTVDTGNNTVTSEQGVATPVEITTNAPVTNAATPESKIVCIVETFDGNSKPRDFTTNIKSLSIERVTDNAAGNAEDAPPFELSAVVVTFEDFAGGKIPYLIPPITKKFTVKNKRIVIDTAAGQFEYALPVTNIKSVKIEKINSLPLPNIKDTRQKKSRLVIETGSGTPERYSLPPNTRKIEFTKANVSTQSVAYENDIPDDLPDFLKYILKIFDTTHWEKIEDDEGEYTCEDTNKAPVTTSSAPIDISGVEIHTTTPEQINIWHNYGGVGYFQDFLRKYGLDYFKPYSCRLFDKYRIGFDVGTEGGSGRGIFPIDDTRYYAIVFKKAVPVDAELANKTLQAFKLADKKSAVGMENISADFVF